MRCSMCLTARAGLLWDRMVRLGYTWSDLNPSSTNPKVQGLKQRDCALVHSKSPLGLKRVEGLDLGCRVRQEAPQLYPERSWLSWQNPDLSCSLAVQGPSPASSLTSPKCHAAAAGLPL